MEQLLQEAIVIAPIEKVISVNGRDFTFKSMGGEEAHNWMSMRLMSWWRQIFTFRKLRANVYFGAFCAGEDSIENENDIKEKLPTDDRLAKICSDFLSIQNHLVAKALGIYNPEESVFVRTLGLHEKNMILAIQDKLNGMDIVKLLESYEKRPDPKPENFQEEELFVGKKLPKIKKKSKKK